MSEIIADVCLDDALAQELVATWAFEIGAPKAGVSLEAIEFQGSAFADFYDLYLTRLNHAAGRTASAGSRRLARHAG